MLQQTLPHLKKYTSVDPKQFQKSHMKYSLAIPLIHIQRCCCVKELEGGWGGGRSASPPRCCGCCCGPSLLASKNLLFQKLLFTDKASSFLPSLSCLLPSFLPSFLPYFLLSFFPSFLAFLPCFLLPSFRPSFLPPLLPSSLPSPLLTLVWSSQGIKCLHNRPECFQDQNNQTSKIQTIKYHTCPAE